MTSLFTAFLLMKTKRTRRTIQPMRLVRRLRGMPPYLSPIWNGSDWLNLMQEPCEGATVTIPGPSLVLCTLLSIFSTVFSFSIIFPQAVKSSDSLKLGVCCTFQHMSAPFQMSARTGCRASNAKIKHLCSVPPSVPRYYPTIPPSAGCSPAIS